VAVSVDWKEGFVASSCDARDCASVSEVSGSGGMGEVVAVVGAGIGFCLKSGVLGTLRRPPTSW
jgi:pantoate kinase